MKSFVFPGNIEDEILSIGNGQIPYMRSQWFSQLVKKAEIDLLSLCDCSAGKVIPYTASGTAAMESCVASMFINKALVINGGGFGKRWADLCLYYKIDHDEFMVDFGKAPNLKQLETDLSSGQYDVLFMQHHETSSGYLYDIETIGQICDQYEITFVVDAISSFMTDAFSMDLSKIDVAVLSSHKGLNLPPGLSFIVLSDSIVKKGSFKHKSFYLDWEENLHNLKRGQTPYSPATQLFMQLSARLKQIKNEGKVTVIAKVKSNADAFRLQCKQNGWKLTADSLSNCATGIILPFEVKPMIDDLFEKGIFVMPCGDKCMIRVAHTGSLNEEDQIELAELIKSYEV